MSTSKKATIIFILILIVYAAYAAIFIYKTSFIVDGQRYFVLFDDAMISMRYAKNLAHGFGAVWNPGGERVEGYTNPLWMVWMALLHFVPISAAKTSMLVQISGAIFFMASFVFVRKIALQLSGSETVGLLAVALTAFFQPLNSWVLLGMEVSVLILLLCAAVYLFLDGLFENRFSPLPYVLLGIGTLVRMDMAVPYVLAMGFLIITDASHRRKHIAWGLSLLAAFLLGQTLLRWSYYGDLLPNTYYLKMTGYPMLQRIARGFYALYDWVWTFNWLLFLLPLGALFFRRDRQMLLVILLFAGQVAYSVYVGGDAWEHKGGSNRYISVAMPLFFTLFVYTLWQMIDTLFNRLNLSARWKSISSTLVLLGLCLVSLVNFNFLQWDTKALERWLLLRQPLFVEGNKEYVRIALDLKEITTPEATVAVVAAGAIPYFSDRPAIDLLGKSDRVIGHQKVRKLPSWRNLEDFRPGHMKWDYDYSIGELKPDVITQLWGDTSAAEAYIQGDYVIGGAGNGLYYTLRKDSPDILWDKVDYYSGG